jgi:hypothetical protein
MIPAVHIEPVPEVGQLWRAFPRWINSCHRMHDGAVFTAEERPVAERLDLAVAMSADGRPIATYKCSIAGVSDADRIWIVLAPLVVVWAGERPFNGFELGRRMIAHLTAAAQRFHRAHGTWNERILIASGNLTEEKSDARFFDTLGWETVIPAMRRPAYLFAGRSDMSKPLGIIEREINRVIAPLRAEGHIGGEAVSFAMLPLG